MRNFKFLETFVIYFKMITQIFSKNEDVVGVYMRNFNFLEFFLYFLK